MALRGEASCNQRPVKEWISKCIFHLKPGDALLTRRSVQRRLMRFNDKNGGGFCPLATLSNAEDPCCSPNGHTHIARERERERERARLVVSPRG